MFTEHGFGHFAHEGQSQGDGVIALHIEKRFDELALIDAHQFPRLTLVKPHAHVGKRLERRAKAALGSARAAGHSAHAPCAAAEKTYQPVGLAERKAAENQRFGFANRHGLVGAPTASSRQTRAAKHK